MCSAWPSLFFVGCELPSCGPTEGASPTHCQARSGCFQFLLPTAMCGRRRPARGAPTSIPPGPNPGQSDRAGVCPRPARGAKPIGVQSAQAGVRRADRQPHGPQPRLSRCPVGQQLRVSLLAPSGLSCCLSPHPPASCLPLGVHFPAGGASGSHPFLCRCLLRVGLHVESSPGDVVHALCPSPSNHTVMWTQVPQVLRWPGRRAAVNPSPWALKRMPRRSGGFIYGGDRNPISLFPHD